MKDIRRIILRRKKLDSRTLDAHIGTFSKRFKIAPYQARVALSGEGLSALYSGKRINCEEAGRVLSDLGYRWAIVGRKPFRARADLVRSFKIETGAIRFQTTNGQRVLNKGDHVIAVLAEFTGVLLGKLAKRAALQGDEKTALSEREKYDALFASGPVLDIHILDTDGPQGEEDRQAPCRLRPGKFNPASLGEKATLSANQNLEKALQVIKKYAGKIELEMDFGLFHMPDCKLEPSKDTNVQQSNFAALTNYGWYLRQLYYQSGSKGEKEKNPDIDPVDALLFSPLKKEKELFKGEKSPGTDLIFDVLPPPPLFSRGSRFKIPKKYIFHIIFLFIWILSISGASVINKAIGQFIMVMGFQKGLFFFILAGGFLYGSLKFLSLRRYMRDTPTSKARSAAMGMTEIKGRCVRKYNLVSPATSAPCVYYRLRKYKRYRGWADKQQTWHLKEDTSSGPAPFFLDDETGRVTVDPAGAKIKPAQKQTYTGSRMTFFGMSMDIPFNEKYVEEVIPEGTTVYVLGFADSQREEKASLRERVARKLGYLKTDKRKLKRYDVDHDGHIDEHEWNAARNDVEKKVLQEELREKKINGTVTQTVIRNPEQRGLPFVISQSSEEKLTGFYKWATAGMLIGTVGSLCLALLLVFGLIKTGG